MRVTCKNVSCKYYYQLQSKEHCQAEEYCQGYTTNRRVAMERIPKCKECKYCVRIETDKGREYHYECSYNNRHRTILMIEDRKCDIRKK